MSVILGCKEKGSAHHCYRFFTLILRQNETCTVFFTIQICISKDVSLSNSKDIRSFSSYKIEKQSSATPHLEEGRYLRIFNLFLILNSFTHKSSQKCKLFLRWVKLASPKCDFRPQESFFSTSLSRKKYRSCATVLLWYTFMKCHIGCFYMWESANKS